MCPDATLGQSWPEGTTVKAVRRTGDFYASGRSEASAKVSKDGSVTLKDLDPGPYWAVGEVSGANVVVSFTAKETPRARARTEAPTRADAQLTPVASPSVEIVEGAKGTKVAGRLTEVPIPKDHEPHPHVNQASVPKGTPQRSDTPLGEGTPVDPGEPQPKPRQDQVKAKTWQRSDTELGEATPIPNEVWVRQEDVKSGTPQRSDTPTGEAVVIGSAAPRGTSSNPDSREQATGERPTDEVPSKGSQKPDVASKLKKA